MDADSNLRYLTGMQRLEHANEKTVVGLKVNGENIAFDEALVNTAKRRVIISMLSNESAGRLEAALGRQGGNLQSVITYLQSHNGSGDPEYQALIVSPTRFVRLDFKLDLMFF